MRPTAFFDTIGMTRSRTTADSISTHFGNIPLNDSPAQSIWSPRHSRLMLKSELDLASLKISTYLESDFMNFNGGQSPYHWRQYWGAVRLGQWEILGGQAWSLLRPNRFGVASDRDTMNTDVIEPAYQVGLTGSRGRQVRLTRNMDVYSAAVAWESDGNLLAKIVRDRDRTHLEVSGLAGRFGRKAAAASAVYGVTSRVRIVTDQFWSKRAVQYAMAVVPAGINGMATLEGVEAQLTPSLEAYSYAGLVYAAHGSDSGNRVVRQWSAGLNRHWNVPALYGSFLLSLQYSYLDRAIWSGKSGQMPYWMYRFRYTFN